MKNGIDSNNAIRLGALRTGISYKCKGSYLESVWLIEKNNHTLDAIDDELLFHRCVFLAFIPSRTSPLVTEFATLV